MLAQQSASFDDNWQLLELEVSFILHMIQQILGECLYKIKFRHKVLKEVLNVIL